MSQTQDKSIQAQIRAIDQEMAGADKRLERFEQAVARIKGENEALLGVLGLSSQADLEKMMQKEGVHPEGLASFKLSLEEAGMELPDFLERLAAAETKKVLDRDEPVKKKKRLKFRL